MADVKWIKITTDMFSNRKIKHLRKLPEGNSIVLIWVMLLTMAGRCNSGGMVFLTENIPYTPKMLAESTVKLALQALEQLGMIVTEEGFFAIPGWEEYQNADGLEKIREQNRNRKRMQRERQKLLTTVDTEKSNVSRCSHVTVRDCHATEEDKERERELEKEKIDYQQIADLYNDTCVSFPRLTKLSDKRKKAIRARLRTYSLDDFKKLFEMAEASSFLKGQNRRNWSATFDWLITDGNMAKVLDGNYNDHKQAARNTGYQAGADLTDLDDLF